jgi:hypothetical protein
MEMKYSNQYYKSGKQLAVLNTISVSYLLVVLTALSITISGIFSGCKKKNEKKPTCRIITASISSSNVVFNFLYNSKDKLSRITTAFGTESFDYPNDSTIVIVTQAADTFQSKKIVTVNHEGLAVNLRIENSISGTPFTNDAFEYNGSEITKQTSTSSLDPKPKITTYTWLNGNLISISTGGATIERREYFTDRLRQVGDFFSFSQFIQGFETVRTINLVKSSSQRALSFSYDFGSDQNITSVKASFENGIVAFQDYQYECK